MPRAVVVVNPVSGSSSAQGAVTRFVRALGARGWSADVRPTERAGHGRDLAREAAAEGAAAVVAAGGDGTLHEVVSGLLPLGSRSPPVGILPLGTSNLVAREAGIRRDPAAAAAVVSSGNVLAMDVADVGPDAPGSPRGSLVACAGVGWDAHVVRTLSERRRGHITFRTWLGPIARALREYRFPEFRVVPAGGPAETAVLALFLNVRPYAAFFRPVPDARPDDGALDALVVSREAVRRLPAIAWRAWRALPPRGEGVRVVRSSSFRIEADEPVPVQIDGDVGGTTPVAMLVRPRALRLLAPPRGEPR